MRMYCLNTPSRKTSTDHRNVVSCQLPAVNSAWPVSAFGMKSYYFWKSLVNNSVKWHHLKGMLFLVWFLSSYKNTGGRGLRGIYTQSHVALLPVFAPEFPFGWQEIDHKLYLYHTDALFPFFFLFWVLCSLINYCCVGPS